MYPKIAEYLDSCIKKNALSHAYIFYGPDESSKIKMAYGFADAILKNENPGFHPDLFSIKPAIDEEISINLIRQLKNFLTLRPYSSEYKVAIVETAEKLNLYAQNALLKIFEEAPSYAVIILCARTLDAISSTIVSRAVKLPFWRGQAEALPPDKILCDNFEILFQKNFPNKYACIEKLDPHANKTLEIFDAWIKFLRIKFKADPARETAELLAKSQNIYFKLNEININPKFAYDELVLSLWKT